MGEVKGMENTGQADWPWAMAKTQLPALVSQLSVVQGLLSSHSVALPATHLPVAQVSPTVQALPSLHLAILLTWLHFAPTGSHVSPVQALPSSQVAAAPPWH